MPDVLLVENRGTVRILTMNRPDKLNALNTELTDALLKGLEAARDDESVRAIVVTGAGRAFCAGADTSEFKCLASDLVVASPTLKLGYPETKHGIVGAIVMTGLTRQLGPKKAFELVALGDPLTADAAHALGLVNRVVPDEMLLDEAVALAEKLAAINPVAMRATKDLFYTVLELPYDQAMEAGRDANIAMRGFRSKT